MKIVFQSRLSPKLQDFIEYKHSLGYKYITGAVYLMQFDRYCLYSGNPERLTKDIVEGWVCLKEQNSVNPDRSWMSPLREFGRYLISIGETEAYVLGSKFVMHSYKPQPYLLNENEIQAFFKGCDEQVLKKNHQGRHLVMPVFFRFLYCCGVRCGEARLLKVENVYLNASYIDIMNSKGFRDRRLYISEELNSLFIKYDVEISKYFPNREYFFPSTTGTCYSSGNIAVNFNIFWNAAGLRKSYGKQPRAYDFRHHFAFSNVNIWAVKGKDVNAMLLYLMRYMGHSSLESTFYYIHVVPDFFAHFSRMTSILENRIPEVTTDEV